MVMTGILFKEDRRSSRIFIEGERIDDDIHIIVTSYNSNVQLAWEIPTETTRNKVTKLTMSLKNAKYLQ